MEVSDLAQSLARLNQEPPVRQDLIDRVRAEIDAGTYDTPERVDGAVSRMLEEIDPNG
ncbi:MAG: flagellar biosynthesis anti-sigma factor FlgM [Phycisphaerales bacterium]|nr:flagellar biosynthesis anti-sigma factor FlgM [Phycisphaerales bacterium]